MVVGLAVDRGKGQLLDKFVVQAEIVKAKTNTLLLAVEILSVSTTTQAFEPPEILQRQVDAPIVAHIDSDSAKESLKFLGEAFVCFQVQADILPGGHIKQFLHRQREHFKGLVREGVDSKTTGNSPAVVFFGQLQRRRGGGGTCRCIKPDCR